jgi:ethanolamine utilization protein EutA
MHDFTEPHYHELSGEAKSLLAASIWKTENVELVTVGIDIGSSTSHLMFAKVHLQRKTQQLSSQFVVIRREILWRSPVILTPFLSDDTIDTPGLKTFIEDSYHSAGLTSAEVDTGAVILTGEAIKRKNARAIAELFAADSGKFVCAFAGHHLESVLAANGSGAVALSRQTHRIILNVDIGGGTTKFALIKNGEILATCAVAVGGRLMACDREKRWTRIDDAAEQTAKAQGIKISLGEKLSAVELDRLVDALSWVVISAIQQKPAGGLTKQLLLTNPLPDGIKPDAVTFSGGVSEYIFGRESANYGDIAQALADKITHAFTSGHINLPLLDPGQGIRATVIGASQFSVQISGKTIHISEGAVLPYHNIPVLFPAIILNENFSASHVTMEIRATLARADVDQEDIIALAVKWRGDPHYFRLRNLADGIAAALAPDADAPLILLLDGDIGKLLGHILEHEIKIRRKIISIDNIQLQEFDYVDIGAMIQPANVVPVIIKSLLFPGR